MKAECVICMEYFQSNDSISASQCGHVFHEACIARWLGESGAIHSVGHCPQCRSKVSKVRLTRLFFTENSRTVVAAPNRRDIDEVRDRINQLAKTVESVPFLSFILSLGCLKSFNKFI